MTADHLDATVSQPEAVAVARLTVRIPKSLDRELDRLSYEQDIPKNTLVERAIRKTYLRKKSAA